MEPKVEMIKDICVTLGDPSGISAEVLFKWLLALEDHGNFLESKTVIHGALLNGDVSVKVFGSVEVLDLLLKRYGLPLKIDGKTLKTKGGLYFNLIDSPYERIGRFELGKALEESALSAYLSLEMACSYLQDHEGASLVTLPINKEAVIRVHPSFIGHTEYLAHFFKKEKVMMCFFSPVFNLSLMTTHSPIADLATIFSRKDFIEERISTALRFHDFCFSQKPLLVLGFNPHAGEQGKIGKEDEVIAGIVLSHQEKGRNIVGPLSADSAFVDVVSGKYDHVLACYHDQGLIPLKMLSKGKSVNFTFGLPFIRASVDHGTAYDIAGTLKADVSSFHYAFLKAYELMDRTAPI